MKIDGIKLQEGSHITNLVVNTGVAFPASPDVGELFYRSDAGNLGLYAYDGAAWQRQADSSSFIAGLGYTPVNRAGDSMTGALVLAADPVAPLEATTRQYCDNQVARVDRVSRLALILAVVALIVAIVALF